MEFNINYKRLKKSIKESEPSNVLLQLPDGLKPYYEAVIKGLEDDAYTLFTWGGSNFGGCDLPTFTKDAGIDLIVHFGHEEFMKRD